MQPAAVDLVLLAVRTRILVLGSFVPGTGIPGLRDHRIALSFLFKPRRYAHVQQYSGKW